MYLQDLTGISLVYLFVVLFADSVPLREAAEQICLVWDLVVALWGKLKEDEDDEDGKAQHIS